MQSFFKWVGETFDNTVKAITHKLQDNSKNQILKNPRVIKFALRLGLTRIEMAQIYEKLALRKGKVGVALGEYLSKLRLTAAEKIKKQKLYRDLQTKEYDLDVANEMFDFRKFVNETKLVNSTLNGDARAKNRKGEEIKVYEQNPGDTADETTLLTEREAFRGKSAEFEKEIRVNPVYKGMQNREAVTTEQFYADSRENETRGISQSFLEREKWSRDIKKGEGLPIMHITDWTPYA